MSTETLIWGAVAVVIVLTAALLIYFLLQRQRRGDLRRRFGPEYERTVAEHDDRRQAEQELKDREQRVDALDIKELPAESRDDYARQWKQVQEHFVDAPGPAVTEADRLITVVMAARGYPTENYEQRVSDLSVEHATTLDHYRTAHAISRRAAGEEASTEDLRQAITHYRALFEELLDPRTRHEDGEPR